MFNTITRRASAAMLTGVLMLGSLGVPALQAAAQTATTKKPHKSFVQRHPHLTSAAAGYGAYKIAKKTGRNRAAHGGKRNFAQRHPVLTGVGAAAVTGHEIKKHRQK